MAIHPALLDMVRELTAPKHPDFAGLVMCRQSPRAMADLLSHNVDPNSEHPNGHTILHADDLPAEVVRLLILAGADVDAPHYGAALRTPLFFCTASKSATHLVEAGADLEARDMDGLTPLMFQALYNAPQIVEELLDLGADPRATDRAGLDALDHASVHLTKDEYAVMEAVFRRHRAGQRREALGELVEPRVLDEARTRF